MTDAIKLLGVLRQIWDFFGDMGMGDDGKRLQLPIMLNPLMIALLLDVAERLGRLYMGESIFQVLIMIPVIYLPLLFVATMFMIFLQGSPRN